MKRTNKEGSARTGLNHEASTSVIPEYLPSRDGSAQQRLGAAGPECDRLVQGGQRYRRPGNGQALSTPVLQTLVSTVVRKVNNDLDRLSRRADELETLAAQLQNAAFQETERLATLEAIIAAMDLNSDISDGWSVSEHENVEYLARKAANRLQAQLRSSSKFATQSSALRVFLNLTDRQLLKRVAYETDKDRLEAEAIRQYEVGNQACEHFNIAHGLCASPSLLHGMVNDPEWYSVFVATFEQSLPADVRPALRHAQESFSWILNQVELDDFGSDLGITPGSAVGLRRKDADLEGRLTAPLTITQEAFPYFGKALRKDTLLKRTIQGRQFGFYSDKNIAGRVVRGARGFSVRKNQKSDRFCEKQPIVNGLLQRDVGAKLRQVLKRVGIDLDDGQATHAEMARKSSLTGEYATLDAENASNSISLALFLYLGAKAPELVRCIIALRSPTIELGKGPSKYVANTHMLSSMGCGFTFEVMTSVFWSLARGAMIASSERRHVTLACVTSHRYVPVSPYGVEPECLDAAQLSACHLEKVVDLGIQTMVEVDSAYGIISEYLRDVKVYGDDVIVPMAYLSVVRRVFESAGLVVNNDKTFPQPQPCGSYGSRFALPSDFHRRFNESCGGEYYKGCKVNPLRLPSVELGNDFGDTPLLVWLYVCFNVSYSRFEQIERLAGMSTTFGSVVSRSECLMHLLTLIIAHGPVLWVPSRDFPETAGILCDWSDVCDLAAIVAWLGGEVANYARDENGSLLLSCIKVKLATRYVRDYQPYVWFHCRKTRHGPTAFYGAATVDRGQFRFIDSSVMKSNGWDRKQMNYRFFTTLEAESCLSITGKDGRVYYRRDGGDTQRAGASYYVVGRVLFLRPSNFSWVPTA